MPSSGPHSVFMGNEATPNPMNREPYLSFDFPHWYPAFDHQLMVDDVAVATAGTGEDVDSGHIYRPAGPDSMICASV